MKQFGWAIVIGLAAFVIGMAFGHYLLPVTKPSAEPQIRATADLPLPSVTPIVSQRSMPQASSPSSEETAISNEEVIAGLQRALSNWGNRRSYVELARQVDLVNASNVREVGNGVTVTLVSRVRARRWSSSPGAILLATMALTAGIPT